MDIITYTLTPEEYQAKLNNCKDDLIERLNEEHGLSLDPAEYLWIFRTKGCLGRMWDKIWGKQPENTSQIILIRVMKRKTTE